MKTFNTATIAIFLGLVNIGLASATELSCAGTEPFWGITSSGKELTFFTPDAPENGRSFKIMSVRQETSSGSVMVIKTENSTLTLLRDSECNDGMSERTFSHQAVYDIDGQVLSGCCNMK